MDEEYYSYIKKWFDKWAPVYNVTEIFLSSVRNKVVNFTNAGDSSKVLDVCTGTGKQAFAFARKGYDVIGLDLSESMLKVARKNNTYTNLKFEISDATNIPFADDYFNVSCISFALHDMPLDIREKVLKEIVRVTRPEGTITIVDYSLPESKIRRFLIYRFVKLYESRYYPEFVKDGIKTLLKKVGVEIQQELPVLCGAGKILKGINNKLILK